MADMCSALDKLSPNTRKRFFDGFPNVLRSSIGRKIYKRFLQEYCEEENNMTFWEMCNDVIEHYEQKDMENRVALAWKVLEYADDMSNLINLDGMQLQQLRKVIGQPGQDGIALLETLHNLRNLAFDWMEDHYLTFREWCDPAYKW